MKLIFLVSLFVLVGSCGDSKDAAEEQASASQIPVEMDEYVAPAPSSSYVLLKEEAAAAADGNEELAIQLTDNARIQAELSIRQAKFEEGAWAERVLSQ